MEGGIEWAVTSPPLGRQRHRPPPASPRWGEVHADKHRAGTSGEPFLEIALVSTDPAQPAFLTSLTYQSVTLPGRDYAALDSLTKSLWVERLIEQDEVNSPEEAAAWIGDLSTHNPTYYQQRIAVYRREARSSLSQPGQALDSLHTAAR